MIYRYKDLLQVGLTALMLALVVFFSVGFTILYLTTQKPIEIRSKVLLVPETKITFENGTSDTIYIYKQIENK